MYHLLLVVDYYPPHRWGAENVYQHIVDGLLQQGYRISILTMHFSPDLKRVEKQWKLTIYRTGKTRRWFLRSAVRKGIRILKQQKIDFIHTATYGWAIPAWILAKLFCKPIVITVHEVFWRLWRLYKGYRWSLPYQRFEKSIFLLPFDKYHCVSRYTMNSIRMLYGIPDNKLEVIYNGNDTMLWDPDSISPWEIKQFKKQHHITSDFVGIYYGHAGKSKGLDYLISVLVPLLETYPNMQFICNIIHSKSSADTLNRLKKLRTTHGLEDRLLLFEGVSQDVLRVLVASCDFVVAPSLAEGFWSVHLEASTMKKILITTTVSAIPEVVYGKVKFIDAGNSQAILQAVGEIQAGEYDILPKKHFDWNFSIKKLEQLYTRMLS